MSAAFAIAAGVVGVAGAATSAGMGMAAASRAAKAQGAASKAAARKEKKALKGFEAGQAQIQQQLGEIPMPVFRPGEDIGTAEQMAASLRKQQEAFLPGAAEQRKTQLNLVNQAMAVLSQGLQGQYGEDLKQTIQRDVAEYAGAGFNPATAGRVGGFQAAQGLSARQLGRTARDVQMESLAAIPSISNVALTWQGLADRYMVQPLDVSRMSLAYQMGAADVGLGKIGVSADLLSSQYGARMNKAQSDYARQIANAEASAARDRVTQQSIQGMTSATSGALLGIGGAYGQLAAAGGGLGGFQYGKTKIGAGGGSVGGMGTYGPNYGLPT